MAEIEDTCMGQKRTSVVSANQAMIAGLQKYYSKKSLRLGGTTWLASAIVATLTSEGTMTDTANQAAAAWHKAVTQLKQQAAANKTLRVQLRAVLLQQFGNDPTALAAFGIAVPKRREPTPPVKTAAAQKSRATRSARHIMGKRQRAAIVVSSNAVTSSAAEAANGANGQTAK
jgi:hypothetical protein